MPQAAAVAAAAATAKIQAMEAVTNTAAAFGLTKEETLPAVVLAGLSPKISVMNVPGIPASVPGVITQPQLGTPKLGLSNAPVVPVANLPPPGIAVIPAVGTIAPIIPSVAPTITSVPGFGPPIPSPVAAPVGIPPVSSVPPPSSLSQIAPMMVASPYQIPSSSVGGVPPPVDRVAIPGQESNSIREELVKRLVEENENLSISAQENVSIRGQSARHEVMQRLMRPESSPVIVLKNMVEPEDVDDSLQEEIMEECSKFGTVERVLIYQETQSEEENAPIVVKIFVEFSNTNEAEAAKNSLNGRFFGGKVVICQIYDFSMYINHDLSG
jgi:poly(U)-binding-splicing factor PUF60